MACRINILQETTNRMQWKNFKVISKSRRQRNLRNDTPNVVTSNVTWLVIKNNKNNRYNKLCKNYQMFVLDDYYEKRNMLLFSDVV